MGDEVSTARALARGATKRCAPCGSGGLFERWTAMRSACPRCGLRFEHEPGYFVGAMAVNFAIVAIAFVAVLVVAMILTVPDVPVGTVLAVTVPIVTIGPIIVYPFSKTLWVAIDRSILRSLSES